MNHYLWKLRPYFRHVAGQLVLGSITGIMMNTAIVLPAILLGRAIDTALAYAQGAVAIEAVGWAVLWFVGGVFATEGPRLVKRWWLMTANARMRSHIRADALHGVLAWPMAQLHQTPIGDVMARIIGDVEVLGVGVREFSTETWDTVLFSVSLIVAMAIYDARLTVLVLLPVPAALALARYGGRWVSQRTTAARAINAELTATLQEHFSGLRLLRLFGRSEAAVTRVAALAQQQADANRATVRLRTELQPLYTVLINAGIMVLIWQGDTQVLSGAMTIGAFVAYLELYRRFIGRGYRIPQMINSIQSGGAAYARLQPLLAPPLPMTHEPRWSSSRAGHLVGSHLPVELAPVEKHGPITVCLAQVSFRYPSAARPALSDVSLEIPAGALVVVTGPVGSGKSALARVLLGLYPLEQGGIFLDGQLLTDMPDQEREARIGYLAQEPQLFSGTVRANVLLNGASGHTDGPGADGDPRLLDDAVTWSALIDDLRAFPAGLDTEMGEFGLRVSGGQRQRNALARAIAAHHGHRPGLLVLDDPFSSIDVDTEAQMIANLHAVFGPSAPPAQRATIMLCSHRLIIGPRADLVVVLEGGRIVEQGPHATLLHAGQLYARIFRAQ